MRTQSRILFLALLMVSLVLLLGYWWKGASSPQRATGPQSEVAPGVVEPNGAELRSQSASLRTGLEPSGAPESALAIEAGKTALALAVPDDWVQLTGRVVGADRQPLAEVTVEWASKGPWGVETVEFSRWKGHTGLVTTTDITGRFHLTAPPLNVASFVVVGTDPYWTSHGVGFDASRAEARPLPAAGVLDLGEFMLLPCGALEFRLIDPEGRGAERAYVALRGQPAAAFCDADGRVQLAHLMPGEFGVYVRANGFLVPEIETVIIEAGRKTDLGTLVLERGSARIAGRVLDERGGAVPGAKLEFWPKSSGSMTQAVSGADGAFEAYLVTPGPQRVGVEAAGYAGFDAFDNLHSLAAPEEFLEIVLKRLEPIRFRLVDHQTGAPVERFGFQLRSGDGSQAPNKRGQPLLQPPIEEHPGGVIELGAQPGIDALVAWAPEYAPLRGDVALTDPSTRDCELRLVRGATVTGRVLSAGTPREGVSWRLVDSLGMYTALQQLAGQSDGQGRFAAEHVASSTYRLEIRDPQGHICVRDDLRVSSEQDLELGDLELSQPGALEVSVRVPDGYEPFGLQVKLKLHGQERSLSTDALGIARFDGLPPGSVEFEVLAREGEFRGSGSLNAEIPSGATTQIAVDLSGHAYCRVNVTFSGDFEHLSTGFQLEAQDPLAIRRVGEGYLAIGAEGAWSGSTSKVGRARLGLSCGDSPRGVLMEPTFDLTAGAKLWLEVHLALGELELVNRNPTPFDPQGRWFLEFIPTESGAERFWIILGLNPGGDPQQRILDEGPDRRVIQALVPGEYLVIVQEATPGTKRRELTRTNLRISAGARTLLEVP